MHAVVAQLIVLPDPIKGAIFALVAFLAAFLLNQIALYWPAAAAFLGQYKDQVVVGLTAAIVGWIEVELNLFPQYENIIAAALKLIVEALIVFGLPFLTFTFLRRKQIARFA